MVDEEFIKKRMESLTSEELRDVLRTGLAGYTERALELAAADLATRADGYDSDLIDLALPPTHVVAPASRGLGVFEAIKICFLLGSSVVAILVAIDGPGGEIDFAALAGVLKHSAVGAAFCAVAWLARRG